jgi:ATP-dependent Clp protease ATP-binding subunit ClpA
MFERFTHEARAVVVRAQEEARALGHSWIGCEHLLLGVLAQQQTPGAAVLGRFGVTTDNFRAAIVEMIGSGEQFSARDADALRTLGIDLDEVRRRVEERFGTGALDDLPPCRQRRLRWRRRPEGEPVPGHIPFTPRAKNALELALREALALKDRHIGVEHVLLGILRLRENAGVELLRQLRVAPEAVRAQLLIELGKAA